MTEIQKIIEGQEEIVSYFQAITSTNCFEQKAKNALELLKNASLIEWVTGHDPVLEEADKDGVEIRLAREGFIVLNKHGHIFPAKYESVVIRGKRVRRWMWWNGNILDNGIVAWAKFPGMPDFAKKEGG